jgi:hypothetical protein
MIRDQNEEELKVYCKGGQKNNEFKQVCGIEAFPKED